MELQAWIASAEKDGRQKTGFGRSELLERAAEIAAKHQLPEDLLERAARVYGVRSLFTMDNPPPDTAAPDPEGSADRDKPNPSGPPTNQEVHDGNGSTPHPAGIPG
jgi:hypothetical protein